MYFEVCLTAVFVFTIILPEIVPHEVAESVALPPEGGEVGQHPGQEVVRGPQAGVKLGRHPGDGLGQPAHGSQRGDACPCSNQYRVFCIINTPRIFFIFALQCYIKTRKKTKNNYCKKIIYFEADGQFLNEDTRRRVVEFERIFSLNL